MFTGNSKIKVRSLYNCSKKSNFNSNERKCLIIFYGGVVLIFINNLIGFYVTAKIIR